MADGEIRWRADCSGIFRRTYLADHGGLPPSNLWTDLAETGHNRQAKYELKTLFPNLATSDLFKTPKPERLLKKIIEVSTAPGDLVLDCYVGSGTTAAVAQKLGRRWVASEWSAQTMAQFTLPRLTSVVTGADRGGVSRVEVPIVVDEDEEPPVRVGAGRTAAQTLQALLKAGVFDDPDGGPSSTVVKSVVSTLRKLDRTRTEVVWSGGGGFRVLEVGPSMFEEVEGRVYLADWAVGGALGEAVAAQFGYDFEPDGPFSGTKGKMRLAVVDGLVNEGVIRLLVDALPEGQRLLVCGTAIDPECRALLTALRPGSTLKKVPAAILDDYRIRRRDRLALASVLDWVEGLKQIDKDLAKGATQLVSTGTEVAK
ncbi:MAG: DNA methyltransferase [Pseudonocardiaceae bacterium]